MTLLDAFALVALLLDEQAAEDVEGLLRDDECAVPAINLAEAIDVLIRVHGVPAADVRVGLDPLLGGTVHVVAQGEADAWRAAELRSTHYHRRLAPLSIADCLLLAAARPGDRVATADPPLAHVARAEGIAVAPLPDSTGVHP